jgi:hypothetical protein
MPASGLSSTAPCVSTKNGLKPYHQHSSQRLFPVQQPRTLGQGLPKPQTSVQAVPFLWPMETLEDGVPPGSEPLALGVPYFPRNPISSTVDMRRPGPLSPSNKHRGVHGAQGNGDRGRPTDNLCG